MTQAVIAWSGPVGFGVVEDPDFELVQCAKAGNAEAFAELVTRHQGLVFNLAYRFMRDSTLAEDMAQEAFLKAYRLLSGFRQDSLFSTWLYRVTATVCLTELDRRKKRREVPLRPDHRSETVSPTLVDDERKELIRRCVTGLPDHYATAITLYYLKEITYDEIAAIMKISTGTLKTWMHRARNQLREIVKKEFADHGLD